MGAEVTATTAAVQTGQSGEGLDIPDAFFILFFALKIRCLKAFDSNAAFNSAGCVYVEIKSDGKK